MIGAWHSNRASSGLVWDLTIAAIVLTVWIIAETLGTNHWRGLWAIPAAFCIGVSCGLPLYLFLRGVRRRAEKSKRALLHAIELPLLSAMTL